MTLVGASLGGGIALDFAHEFPHAVKKLVLIDAQGFIDGSGPGASLPAPLAKLGIFILGSKVISQSRSCIRSPQKFCLLPHGAHHVQPCSINCMTSLRNVSIQAWPGLCGNIMLCDALHTIHVRIDTKS